MKKNIFFVLVVFFFFSCNHYFNLSESEWNSQFGDEEEVEKVDTLNYSQYVYSHWKMDENSSSDEAVDSLGNLNLSIAGVNATINTASGKINNCRGGFSSSTCCFSTISFPYNTGQSFVFEGWVMINDTAGGESYIIHNTVGILAVNNGEFLYRSNNNIKQIEYGEWYYFVVYYNTNGDNKVYINNELVFNQGGYILDNLTTSLNMGNSPVGGGGLNGYIDDVAYWSDVPSDITELEDIINYRWNDGNGREYASP